MSQPLSSTYTAATFWRQAVRDLNEEAVGKILSFERNDLISRAQQTVQSMFADLVAEAYMDSFTPTSTSNGRSGLAQSATYTSATRTLSGFASMTFTSADIGKTIIFVNGDTDAIYYATILSITSSTSIVLTGFNLPSGNVSPVATIIVSSFTYSSDSLSLIDPATSQQIPILRYGNQVKISINSSVTGTVNPVTIDAYRSFKTSSPQNLKTIVWCLTSSSILLKKGDSLSSYGTLTVYYPRIAMNVSATQTGIDLLDGAMCQIGIRVLRNLIADRIGVAKDANREALKDLVASLYGSFKNTASKETIEQKVEALL